MKFFDVLKYLGLIILITFLISWANMNKGSGPAPTFPEAVLYYFWRILIVLDKIFNFNKDIQKNNDKNN
jgi:hypothetical protein